MYAVFQIETMKRILTYLLFLFAASNVYAQPVTVQVTMVPPVSANLGQLLSPVNGKLMVQLLYNSQPGSSVQLKLAGKLERLSPSPLSIELSPSFMPALPITLQAGVPLMLTNSQVQQSFGNLKEGNLVFTNTSPAALKDRISYKIPEGLYRLCIVAYSYGQGNQPLSNPAAGCGTFTVCYKAAAPQLIQPVNSAMVESTEIVVKPASPLVFTWTAPASTCGLVTSLVDYDFEIRRVFPGQTAVDAINNPYVFQKKSLPSASLILDTFLYKNVLQR